MDGAKVYHSKWSKPDREKYISYDIAYVWYLKKSDTNEFIHEKEIDPQTQKQTNGYKIRKGGGTTIEFGVNT